MKDRAIGHRETPRTPRGTRREFLKVSAAAAIAAAGSTPMARAFLGPTARISIPGRGNAMPGRIVLFHDPSMEGHEATINRDRVEAVVHHGIRLLTGIDDTAEAFESLFPGLHAGSTIAIKVNCLAWNDTRWEVVRGVVSGLSLMLGGTYNVGRVTIYDVQSYLPDHGYVEGQFTFNGNTPLISSTNNCSPDYYVYGDHRLSNYILNGDYVINVPVLKAHNAGYPEHQITTAFKNHYGSLCPQNLCNNITGMLTVNSDPNIRNKTSLVLTSALRGTYSGGPWEPPQLWNTYPDQTPNTLFFTTDPVTEAYWARDIINMERASRGWSTFPCTWIEQASVPPYDLGISDPEMMTVVYYAPADVGEESVAATGATFLAPNAPNPFSDCTTLRIRLAREGYADLTLLDPSGRLVRHLVDRELPAGYSEIGWDGRDDAGRRLPAGVYFARLRTRDAKTTRRILVAR